LFDADRCREASSQFEACRRAGAAPATLSGTVGSSLSIEPGSTTTEPLTLPPVSGP